MALTKVKLIADGTIVQSHLNASHGITTADIGEGSNLYYTDARARAAVSVSGNALSYNSSTGVITSNYEESPTFTGDVHVGGAAAARFKSDGTNTIVDAIPNPSSIIFRNSGAVEKMRLDSSGNLGIGTTSPSQKLHVQNGYLLVDTNSAVGSGIWMPDINGNPSLRIVTDQATGSYTSIVNAWGNSSNTGVMLGTIRNDGIAFQVRSGVTLTSGFANDDGSTRFIVKGDGNVGINDTLGYGKLSIKTSGTFTTDSNDLDFSGVNIVMKTDSTAINAVGSGMVWIKGGNNSRKVAAITNYIYGDTDQSGLNFYVQPTASGSIATLTEAMRIDNSGNVGINETNPDVKLKVVGNGNSDTNVLTIGNFEQDDSGDETANIKFELTRSYTNTLNHAGYIKVGKERAWSSSGGRQSFMSFLTRNGSSDPAERMRIASDGKIQAQTSGGYYLTESTTNAFSITSNGANGYFKIRDEYNSSDRFYISNTGNVGIGTTSPDYNVHVATTSATYVGISNQGTATGDRQLRLGFGNGHTYATIQGTRRNIADDVDIVLQGGGGNVGIGTTDLGTEAKLAIGAISSSEGGQMVLHKGTNGTYAPHLDAYFSGGVDYLRILRGTNTTSSAAPFVFDLTNTRLGIGTTLPNYTLDVEGGSATGFRSYSTGFACVDIESTRTSGNIGGVRWETTGDSHKTAEINAIVNGGLNFRTGTGSSAVSTKMTITSSGGLIVGAGGVSDVNNIVNVHLIEGNSTSAGIAPTGFYNNSGTANVPAVNILQRDTSTDSSCRFIQFYAGVTNSAATAMGGIVGNGSTNVQFASISDIREKENIKSINGSLDKINKLNPVEFDLKKTGEHIKAGFVAQEVEEIFPEYVIENFANDGEEERKGLTGGMTAGIVAHLVKSIQELKAEIETLKTQING